MVSSLIVTSTRRSSTTNVSVCISQSLFRLRTQYIPDCVILKLLSLLPSCQLTFTPSTLIFIGMPLQIDVSVVVLPTILPLSGNTILAGSPYVAFPPISTALSVYTQPGAKASQLEILSRYSDS